MRPIADIMRLQMNLRDMVHMQANPSHAARLFMAGPIYALNLFNIADREEYLAYSRRSAREVQAHGGHVVALGKFNEAAAGDIKPRAVMILVEWASKEAFDSYCNDPKLDDLHLHREKGARDYIWHLFDKLEDLRPVLK